MDAEQIRRLKPELTGYLHEFDDCFARRDTRAHFPRYVEGQLSELPGKSCEPMALAAGVAPRTLQEFLAQHRWDEDRMRRRVQQLVMRDHAGPHAIGVIDETSDVKKGDKTPGVQRQYCGCVGKQENGIVTVHLGYAQGDFHALIDGELFLPESWSEDRARCRAAGIPEEMVYRPKWKIALELYDRAVAGGVELEWLTCDEGYGGKPLFLQGLDGRQQRFVAEVPTTFSCWPQRPRVTERPFRRGGRGRPRKVPRLVAAARAPQNVKELAERWSVLRDQAWARYYVKDGQKGPLVWEAKCARVVMKNDDGLPGVELHLVVARNALDHDEVKYFVSNAPAETPVGALLLVAFSRWRVERCFRDQKQEIGLDQWEGRCYLGLKRHLILSCVSYLFLTRCRERLRGEKPGGHRLPSPRRRRRAAAQLVARRPRLADAHGTHGPRHPALATT
ncbi:MAG: IS701 family transposase [Planctomycetales bacterium]|nr:IS701 family transposase [Planctomycetales bacterium]